MKEILIIGNGEIGKSLKQVEEEAGNKVYMRDVNPWGWQSNDTDEYDVCHVAIPYKSSNQFIADVHKHMLSYSAGITIINSTVEVGTTRKLIEVTGNAYIVHSFVRGVHPNLAEGIKTFTKYVGGKHSFATAIACEHFNSLDITIEPVVAEESEMAKLLSTTYYGWNILFAKMVNELCEDHDLSYNVVYKIANETYNSGYKSLGMDNVIRPVLTPPEGRLGGHCVTPNFHLLPDCNLKKICIEEEQNVRC
jgi:UDP-N-acetyl-D-mannosaminuronate dehydrogenase